MTGASRRRRAALFATALFAAAGCAAAGCAAFAAATIATARTSAAPASQVAVAAIRFRYVTDLSDGSQARQYGFNLVDLGPYRDMIDALPSGERALVWLGGYSLDNCAFVTSDASVRQEVVALSGDPKVAGYYLDDEADDALPANGGHCPDVAAQVAARSRLVHQLTPGPFTYEVVTEPEDFAAFAHATDVLGTDPYPCLKGHACDWSEIPRYVADLQDAHVTRYWGVIQAFSWGKWRSPTPAELAHMIAQWQRSRWQGEQIFAWHYGTWSLAGHPELLTQLRTFNLR